MDSKNDRIREIKKTCYQILRFCTMQQKDLNKFLFELVV